MVDFKDVDLEKIFGDKKIIKIGSDFMPVGRVVSIKTKEIMSYQITKIIDHMGELSADAQRLNESVTSSKQMRDGQWVLLIWEPGTRKICGLLKAGYKDLYLYDDTGTLTLMKNSPSLLDFYVHESCQRRGYGLKLYEHMLTSENWQPEKIAIDRPSTLMMSFMKKKFGLSEVLPQANHFTIFSGFFGHKIQKYKWDHAQKMRNDLQSLNGYGGAGERQ